MSFNWIEYLKLADYLYATNQVCSSRYEAHLRAAISRGYYAAFCSARNFARSHDGLLLRNSGKDHADVKDFYKKNNDKNKKKIGLNLDRLRKFRNSADYDNEITYDVLIEYTQATLEDANKVILLLEQFQRNKPQ